ARRVGRVPRRRRLALAALVRLASRTAAVRVSRQGPAGCRERQDEAGRKAGSELAHRIPPRFEVMSYYGRLSQPVFVATPFDWGRLATSRARRAAEGGRLSRHWIGSGQAGIDSGPPRRGKHRTSGFGRTPSAG